MLDQIQRVQIRRIERDVFESDELVKRCLRILDRGPGGGGRSGNGSSSDGDGGGGGGGAGAHRRSSVRAKAGSVRGSGRRASATGGHFREVEERETIRIRPEGGNRSGDGEASNTGRRRRTSPRPRVEYEVVQPGRIYVDADDDRGERVDDDERYVTPARRSATGRNYGNDRRDRYVGVDRSGIPGRIPSRERRRDRDD